MVSLALPPVPFLFCVCSTICPFHCSKLGVRGCPGHAEGCGSFVEVSATETLAGRRQDGLVRAAGPTPDSPLVLLLLLLGLNHYRPLSAPSAPPRFLIADRLFSAGTSLTQQHKTDKTGPYVCLSLLGSPVALCTVQGPQSDAQRAHFSSPP